MKKLWNIIKLILAGLSFWVIVSIIMALSAHANDLKIGYVHALNPHSAAPGKCLDNGNGMSLAFDLTLDKGGLFQFDVGLQTLLLNFTESKRDCVGCPKTDTKARHSINITPYAKPTINLWRFGLYGLAGYGFDYMHTEDKASPALLYGYGIDFKLVNDIIIGIEKQEIIRADNGRYRLPVVAMLKFRF